MGWFEDAKKKANRFVSDTSNAAKKTWDVGIGDPTKATVKAVQTGSIAPITKNVQDTFKTVGGAAQRGLGQVTEPLKDGLQNLGGAIGGGLGNIPNPFADFSSAMSKYLERMTKAQDEPMAWGAQNITTKYGGKTGLGLTSEPDWSKSYASSISANEAAPQTLATIGSRYANLSNLAKMREGSASSQEQNAMNRRLASSGMLGSGAGMKMMRNQQEASNRRLAEQNLALSADQANQEQAAMEAANTRNMQRDQLRLEAENQAATRGIQQQQLRQQAEQAASEFELNREIANQNMQVARDVAAANKKGLLGSLFPAYGNMIAGIGGENNFLRQMLNV